MPGGHRPRDLCECDGGAPPLRLGEDQLFDEAAAAARPGKLVESAQRVFVQEDVGADNGGHATSISHARGPGFEVRALLQHPQPLGLGVVAAEARGGGPARCYPRAHQHALVGHLP